MTLNKSIYFQAEYAKAKGLGGVMVWSVETDDFKGLCGKVDILLNAIKTTLKLVKYIYHNLIYFI